MLVVRFWWVGVSRSLSRTLVEITKASQGEKPQPRRLPETDSDNRSKLCVTTAEDKRAKPKVGCTANHCADKSSPECRGVEAWLMKLLKGRENTRLTVSHSGCIWPCPESVAAFPTPSSSFAAFSSALPPQDNYYKSRFWECFYVQDPVNGCKPARS